MGIAGKDPEDLINKILDKRVLKIILFNQNILTTLKTRVVF